MYSRVHSQKKKVVTAAAPRYKKYKSQKIHLSTLITPKG